MRYGQICGLLYESRSTLELADTSQKITALDQQVGQLQQRAQDAEAHAASLDKHLEVNQQALNDSQDSNARLSAELNDTRSETARHIRQLRAAHRKQADTLARERNEVAAARDREIERADEQQKAWAEQIDQARQATRAAEAEHDKQLTALRQARDQAIIERDEKAQSVRDHEQTIERLNADLKTQPEHVTALEASVDEANQQTASVSTQLQNMQSEYNALREKLASITAIADERRRLLNRLERAPDSDRARDQNKPKKR